MSVASLYVLHGLTLPTGEHLVQLTEHQNNPTVEQMTAMGAGHPHPQFVSTVSVKPEISFTTTQLKTLLDKTKAAAAGATAKLTGGTGTDLYYKRVDPLGLRVANATAQHRRYRGTLGILAINTLTAEHRGTAEAQCQLVLAFDGNNPPIVPTGSVALAGTSAAAEQYTLGPAFIDGAPIPSLQRMSWSAQPQWFREGSNSEVYDSFVAAQTLDALFTFQSLEAAVWDAIGLTGSGLGEDGLEVYLRRKDPDGFYFGDDEAEHIKISATHGHVVLGPSSGGGINRLAHELRVQAIEPPAGGSAITIDTASTIPDD